MAETHFCVEKISLAYKNAWSTNFQIPLVHHFGYLDISIVKLFMPQQLHIQIQTQQNPIKNYVTIDQEIYRFPSTPTSQTMGID